MGGRSLNLGALLVLLVCVCQSGSAEYQNFTVGDNEGWTSNPSVTYSKWASDKNFTLGDYLIFNFAKPAYDVIHTYNETVYKNCDYMNSDGDFEVWGEPGTTVFVAIPLVLTGPNYFFCGVNDTKLCQEGMKFSINVTVGDGLPASLAIPPPSPVNETSPSQPTSPTGDHDASSAAQYLCPHGKSFLLALIVLPLLWGLSK